MDFERIGLRMRNRREELGLTLAEVGDRLGTSASVVLRWERGDIKSLKTTKLCDIAKALNMTVEELLGVQEVYVPMPGLLHVDETEGDVGIIAEDASMLNARIWPGDTVFIKEKILVEDGSIAACLFKEKLLIRRIYRYEGRIELRSENPMFPTISIEGNDLLAFKVIGKAIGIWGEVK